MSGIIQAALDANTQICALEKSLGELREHNLSLVEKQGNAADEIQELRGCVESQQEVLRNRRIRVESLEWELSQANQRAAKAEQAASTMSDELDESIGEHVETLSMYHDLRRAVREVYDRGIAEREAEESTERAFEQLRDLAKAGSQSSNEDTASEVAPDNVAPAELPMVRLDITSFGSLFQSMLG